MLPVKIIVWGNCADYNYNYVLADRNTDIISMGI